MRKRNLFNIGSVNNSTFKMGYIVPVNVFEVLPGDTIQGRTSVLLRLAPMLSPLMHTVIMHLYHFYIPFRLCWDRFADHFITGGPDGMDDSVPPTISIAPTVSTLADYMGLPLSESPLTVSAMPFRAYNLVYNNYFRDQDLMPEVPVSLESGADVTTSTTLLRAAWQKDYFTTARPWPQKGPQVTVPVDFGSASTPTLTGTVTGTGAPSFVINGQGGVTGTTSLSFTRVSDGGDNPQGTYNTYGNVQSATWPNTTFDVATTYPVQWADPALGVTIDYTPGEGSLGSIEVSALREAMALQRMEEHRALYGSRYEDLLRYYGVRPEDARLQHPEYLAGGSQTIQMSEVLQTAKDEVGNGVGDMYGHGIGAMRSNRFRRFIPEHGLILSLCVVRPTAVYTQGIDRMWSRATKEDYWQKELQHIGQQEVYNREIYADGSEDDGKVFGYQNRYDEYRRGVNKVTGEFRTTLDYWNMARIFAQRPVLNADFVTSNPTDRIFQASESLSDQCYCMIKNDVTAKRLVDKNGNPM